MHAFIVNWDPPRRHLRAFAWVAALVLALFAVFYESSPSAWSLRLAAAAIFAVGTVLPRMLRWPYFFLLVVFYPVLWLLKRALPVAPQLTSLRPRRPRVRARRSAHPV
jgi:hypothetical protein